jgi:hypothetical protein
MGKIYLEAAKEAQRRDRLAIYRHKYVAGSAALKQFAIRSTGVYADALWQNITCSPLSPSDRDLFSLDPAHNETSDTTSELERQGRGNDDRGGDLPSRDQPSLSWLCAFCGKLRFLKADDRSYSPISIRVRVVEVGLRLGPKSIRPSPP